MKISRRNFLAVAGVIGAAAALTACGGSSKPASTAESTSTAAADAGEAKAESAVRVAMVTDYGDITDQSFNQTTYEACNAFCGANNVDFTYYKPGGDSSAERVAMIDAAIEDGFNVIVMPGYAFGEAIAEEAPIYPEIKFIGLDVSAGDLGDLSSNIPSNVYCAVYQEELSGYMAGYAAVKLGYEKLAFLGGMAVPAVLRFGYGFVQGADAAAVAMDKADAVSAEIYFANQFYGDSDITAAMDTCYAGGVELVFACGGGVFTSAAEAAAKVGGKVVGVDTDQSSVIDGAYGAGMTVTSAMKGLAPTVKTALTDILAGNWANYGGKIETLGLVSANPDDNYVQLPVETTQWADGFTQDDYKALVADMFDGKITVSNDITAVPATTIKVADHGNIK